MLAEAGRPHPRHKRKVNSSLVAGLVITALVFMGVYVGPIVIRHDPLAQNLSIALQSPNATHVLGTDNFGRDLLARILYAGRTDLQIGIIATLISLAIGTVIGAPLIRPSRFDEARQP